MTHILVVDDEQPILELIKNGLRKDGYLITACQKVDSACTSGHGAYEYLCASLVPAQFL